MAKIIIKQQFRISLDSRNYTEEINYTTQEFKQISKHNLEHNKPFYDDTDFTKVIDYSSEEYKQNNLTKFTDYTFSNKSNNISDEQINLIKKKFMEAQQKGSFLFKTYISFEDNYLTKNGIVNNGVVNENLLKNAVISSMKKMLKKEDINDYTFLGNIHYDTDNIHAHIYTVENGTPTRKYNYLATEEKEKYRAGKFKTSTFELGKSEIEKYLSKDYENLIEIQNIFRNKILKHNFFSNKDNFFSNEFELKDIEKLKSIYNKLPENKNLWQYNNKAIKNTKEELKNFSKYYLKKYHSKDFEELDLSLQKTEKYYTEVYGQKKNYKYKHNISNGYRDNKLEEIYIRTANKILKELKDIDFEKHQNTFKINNLTNKKHIKIKDNLIKKIKKYPDKKYNNVASGIEDIKNNQSKKHINSRNLIRIIKNLSNSSRKNIQEEKRKNKIIHQQLLKAIDKKDKYKDI